MIKMSWKDILKERYDDQQHRLGFSKKPRRRSRRIGPKKPLTPEEMEIEIAAQRAEEEAYANAPKVHPEEVTSQRTKDRRRQMERQRLDEKGIRD